MRKIILNNYYLIVLFTLVTISCNEIEESIKLDKVDMEEYTPYTLPENVDISALSLHQLYVIRTSDEFKAKLGEDVRPGIDFAVNTLLLVKGQAYQGLQSINPTYYKDEKGNFLLQLDVISSGISETNIWAKAVLVPVIPIDKTVSLRLNN